MVREIEQGQRIVECSRNHNLILANTWFQTKKNNRHTWTTPDGKTRNRINYILIDKCYRNGIRNCQARQDADCGSDHNPVLAYFNIKLQKISSNRSTGMASNWNTELLKDDNIQQQFKELTNAKLQNTTDVDEPEELWMYIKSSILEAAEDTCGKQVPTK